MGCLGWLDWLFMPTKARRIGMSSSPNAKPDRKVVTMGKSSDFAVGDVPVASETSDVFHERALTIRDPWDYNLDPYGPAAAQQRSAGNAQSSGDVYASAGGVGHGGGSAVAAAAAARTAGEAVAGAVGVVERAHE